ncbi:hypothetical protein SAMN05421853_11772 [Roseivivax halotolerans]|uniref:Uncharacterized protein n=1 Tax=Roseivivax halotolerans TaxID=93684 RepID=A0A1I6ADD2_9RHOB|nr:hypothetical protein [Roseivivax halotolerans]SFQ66577.1 hypothetical protein SAMN05421853_11772 [Roseivivax halotolerans]
MDLIMDGEYSTREAAAALQHGNFGVFQRNYNASKMNLLPRFKETKRGHVEYSLIAERALHLAVAATHSREIARATTWGILDELVSSAVPSGTEIKGDLASGYERLAELEPSEGHQPLDLRIACTSPQMVFSESIISRDPDQRTWAVYHLRGDGARALVTLMQDDAKHKNTLQDARAASFEMATQFASSERVRDLLGEAASYPQILDLTGVFLSFEANLRFQHELRSAGRMD